MQFDLVSAYSVRAKWSAELDVTLVQCHSKGFNTVSKCEERETSVVVVNLSPGTSYTLHLTLKDGGGVQADFETCPADRPCLQNLYKSTLDSEGVYNTTMFNKETHDVFVKHFSDIVQAGDRILAPVSLRGAKKDILTRAVTDGTTMEIVDDSSLFLPFSDKNESVQTVTLRRGPDESTVVYDASCNSVCCGGVSYAVGETMDVLGKTVTVGDGSIVLVFSDVVAKVFPFSAAVALSVVGTRGSSFMKNQVANTSSLIASKTTGAKGDTSASCWVHDTDLSTTNEITRVVHSVDESSNFATLSMGVLHTDAASNKFIEPTVQVSSTATTISAQDANDTTRSAFFESAGLSFDSDDSAVYFGASKQFRIKFSDGSPSYLQVQSSDGVGGYVTKTEFSDST
ncbi:unnamed protein product [Ectocarpus sp. 8 AP-2014]